VLQLRHSFRRNHRAAPTHLFTGYVLHRFAALKAGATLLFWSRKRHVHKGLIGQAEPRSLNSRKLWLLRQAVEIESHDGSQKKMMRDNLYVSQRVVRPLT
jgi:hypothetical protein